MSRGQEARETIGDLSKENIDQLVRPAGLSDELEEVCAGPRKQMAWGKKANESYCRSEDISIRNLPVGYSTVNWRRTVPEPMYPSMASQCKSSVFDHLKLTVAFRLWERSARECLNDMHWLEKYLVTRGGRSKPSNIEAPTCEFSDCSVDSVVPCKDALLVEKRLLEDLERLCSLAEKSGKTSLAEAIKARFLRKEAKHVKNMGDLLKQVARVSKCPGLGLHILDMELRNHKGILPWTVLNDPDRPDEAIEHGVGPISDGLEKSHLGHHKGSGDKGH